MKDDLDDVETILEELAKQFNYRSEEITKQDDVLAVRDAMETLMGHVEVQKKACTFFKILGVNVNILLKSK